MGVDAAQPGEAVDGTADVVATVQHAVALAALQAVESELSATRKRVRAVTDRWIPRLEGALDRVALSLEETERAEGVGLRWALRAHETRDGRP